MPKKVKKKAKPAKLVKKVKVTKKTAAKKPAKKVVKKAVKKAVKKIVKKAKTTKKATKAVKTVKKAKVVKKAKKAKVLAVPKGYHSVTPYLIVHNAADAITFYKNAFGAKEIMRVARAEGKITHAEIEIAGSKIMLADEHPEFNARSPKDIGATPVSIHLYVPNVDAVVAKAVDLGAHLLRDVETMYYGDRSGGVCDPFGHQWYVSTHVEDVKPAEMKKRLDKLSQNDISNDVEEQELVHA